MNQCKIFEMSNTSRRPASGSLLNKGGKGGIYDLYPEGNTLVKVIKTEFSEHRIYKPSEKNYNADINNYREQAAAKEKQKAKELETKITSAKNIASFINEMRESRKNGEVTLHEVAVLMAIKERLKGDEKSLKDMQNTLRLNFNYELSLPAISIADLRFLLSHAQKTNDKELAGAIGKIWDAVSPIWAAPLGSLSHSDKRDDNELAHVMEKIWDPVKRIQAQPPGI